MRCSADVGRSAEARCPEGSSSEPRGYNGILYAVGLVWLPLALLLEWAARRVSRRPKVVGRFKGAIEDVMMQQRVLRAMRGGGFVARVGVAVGELVRGMAPDLATQGSAGAAGSGGTVRIP